MPTMFDRNHKSRPFDGKRGLKRQRFPRNSSPYQAVEVLEYPLLLRRDVGMPYHQHEDDPFLFRVISCPVEVARVHAQQPVESAIVYTVITTELQRRYASYTVDEAKHNLENAHIAPFFCPRWKS